MKTEHDVTGGSGTGSGCAVLALGALSLAALVGGLALQIAAAT